MRGRLPGLWLGLGLLGLSACKKIELSPGTTLDDPQALLARASMDLRGQRPSEQELALAVVDPASVDDDIAAWLDAPTLSDRLVALWGPIWLTQADEYLVPAAAFGEQDEPAFLRSVGQQPLRHLARVVTDDRPWSQLITADWTVADPLMARIAPLERESDADGWQLAWYTDYRPALGAFDSPGMYLRFTSTEFNAQRSRANAMSRILLCDDFLARPISVGRGVALLDQEAAQEAIRTDPSCKACHDTLDPIAANFWGFHQMFDSAPREYTWYHPEREVFWEVWSGVGPGFQGQNIQGAHELGPLVAAADGFTSCAVSQARQVLLQDAVQAADPDGTERSRQAYDASGGRMKAVLWSVTQQPAWRAVGQESAGDAGRKLISADLLESSMAGLVGATFRLDGWGLTDNDREGLRTLAGGVDGRFQTQPADRPTPTSVLVQARLAELVAGLATQDDRPGALFAADDLSADLDTAAWNDRDRSLSLRVLSRPPTEDELSADRALYDAARATGATPAQAWQAVLTALLRDPAAMWD